LSVGSLVALSTVVIACFSPSCASEITRRTRLFCFVKTDPGCRRNVGSSFDACSARPPHHL
jgi:hypothetical protein